MSEFKFSTNLIKFEDVRQQIIDFLQDNSEYSASFDWDASNISYLIDTMAYISMMMSYQISNVANNIFLDSATLRKNAVSKAKEIGVRPRRKVSPRVVGYVVYEDLAASFVQGDSITILKGSPFIGSFGNIYTNKTDIVLSFEDSTTLKGYFEVYEGIQKQYVYTGIAGDADFQSFIIPSKSIEENSFDMAVDDGLGNTQSWTEAKNIFDIPDKYVYFVEEDKNTEYYPKIIFGDDVISRGIKSTETATLKYVETKGSLANGESIVSSPDSLDYFVTTFATPTTFFDNFSGFIDGDNVSFGGKEYDTLGDIQNKALTYFAARGRAVTQTDYNTLLKSFSNVLRSIVIGGDELYPLVKEELGNIYISIAPSTIAFDSFLDNQNIYSTYTEEQDIFNALTNYKIISTKFSFFKPSYLYSDLTPKIEFKRNTPATVKTQVKANIKTDLETYSQNTYFDYGKFFRLSNFNSVIDGYSDIVSVYFDNTLYFLMNKDSFYPSILNRENFITLPILDNNGTTERFIKTNTEIATSLGLTSSDEVPIENRSLYGNIVNSTVDRKVYNEDDEAGDSQLIIDGRVKLFDFFKFENNAVTPLLKNQKTINGETVNITPIVSGVLDSYEIRYGSIFWGTVYDTNNPYFKGYISSSQELPEYTSSPTELQGFFVECKASFDVLDTATATAYLSVKDGDWIVYNSVTEQWQKTNYQGEVSALTDSGLSTQINSDGVYNVLVAGTGGGKLTSAAEVADFLIYNQDSVSNPIEKWEICNYRLNKILDSSIALPKEAIPFDIKLVVDEIGAGTSFDNESDYTYQDGDLIYFDSTESVENLQWKKLINIFTPAEMDALRLSSSVDATTNDLFIINYSALNIGELRIVDVGGNFNYYDKIIWPTDSQVAFTDNILVYVGDSTWRIFQNIFSYYFEIDGSVKSALPIAASYNDYFVVQSPDAGADFNEGIGDICYNGDYVIYLGDNTWKKIIFDGTIDASSAAGFPVIAQTGDVLKVTQDGNFLTSAGVQNPFVVSNSKPFVDGDYIIFISDIFGNGHWRQMKEYSFVFNTQEVKDSLNSLSLSTVFNVAYNFTTKYYEIYFNDIFDGVVIGSFTYDPLFNEDRSFAKIVFNNKISGYYNSIDQTDYKDIRELFSEDNTISKIKITPKTSNNILITDFNSNYNNFITVNVNDAEIL